MPTFFSRWLILFLLSPFCMAQQGLAPTTNNFLPQQTLTGNNSSFLPVDEAFQLTTELTDTGALYLNWRIADGYYLYKHMFKFTVIKGGEPQILHPKLKDGLKTHDEYFGDVEIYYQGTDLLLEQLPKTATSLSITSQGCADAGLCYPPQTQTFAINLEQGSMSAADEISGATHQSTTAKTGTSTSPIAILLAAVAGGLILNLMPCVFPVLSLKVLGFANDHQHKQYLHGLSYGAGVVASFVGIALLLISLRSAGQAIGWGFQLQVPWFVAMLAYLFFAMGLSLSGLVEFGGNWMNVGSSLTRISGYHGSFFTGVLATVVASPCTAPFMGSALGFAATQPTSTALLIFAALGLGMAMPVILLSCSPGLLKRMPKPGPWMEHFKQWLAFPLYATAIWLAWVVGNQIGINGMTAVISGCLLLALALWLWNGKTLSRSIAAIAAAIALAILSSPLLEPHSENDSKDWIDYQSEELNKRRNQGQAVFLNVTADWCITCLTNEKLVLASHDVQQAMIDNRVSYMKADWTNPSTEITALLEEFGRNGVPLYVYFPPTANSEGIVLPQLLRSDTLLRLFSGDQ
jgi:thiol:disulfide interchange protein DsbD